ncbi:MAG: DEAD/DEAH box helicase [Saprospiraceae bacterium]|nr:DEAD/DEAH box helicase [Saprospiraceae bacterium]
MLFSSYPFSDTIKRNLDLLGFRKPTDIQYKSIPSILKGEDVLAIAQTGTGKTAAFAIPVLHILSTQKKKPVASRAPRCLVMVPTHELAVQVKDVFRSLAKNTGLQVMALYGGVDQTEQKKQLKQGIDILVATPGRMFDLRAQGFLLLDFVEILVLDEADHMLDLGFLHDINDVLKYVPGKRQTLFFSATIDDGIKKTAYRMVHNPIRIQVSPKDPVAKNVDHFVLAVPMDEKRFYLERLVKENVDKKILVFVRTKVRAERVAKAMQRVGIQSLVMHGGIDQQARSTILGKFKQSEKLMIATDVSARGVDIPDVALVINYDLPEQAEQYVHRVGRTGRGDKRGKAVSFCSDQEKNVLEDIEHWLGSSVDRLEMSEGERFAVVSQSEEMQYNLKSLMDEIEEMEKRNKRKGKR